MTDAGGDEPPRLAPAMASRRLIVLAFVRDYLVRWGASPSQGEIAAGCGISRSRARQLVKALVREQLLDKAPGERGLSLPGTTERAIAELRRLGWQVDEAARCAISTLPVVVTLDYREEVDGDGAGDGEAAG